MAKKRKEPRKLAPPPSASDQARHELLSHILRCGVLAATPEQQKPGVDDTRLSLADRSEDRTEANLPRLRTLGERYCQPAVGRRPPVGADASPTGATSPGSSASASPPIPGLPPPRPLPRTTRVA